MPEPHRCPICCGEGTIAKPNPLGHTVPRFPLPDTCHACAGKGFVWEPDYLVGELDYQPVPPGRTFFVKTRYAFMGKGEPAPYDLDP